MRKTLILFAVLVATMVLYAVPTDYDVGAGYNASVVATDPGVLFVSTLEVPVEAMADIAISQIFISCNQCIDHSAERNVNRVVPPAKYGKQSASHLNSLSKKSHNQEPAIILRC